MNAEHTPTPWRVSDTVDSDFNGTLIVASPGGEVDEIASTCRLSDEVRLMDKPNAAFIVRAVNAHEELLSAVKYLLLCHRNDPRAIINPDAIRHAVQAIAKAEGK